MEWIPSEEEYNPGIAKEQWIELVQDKNIFNENALITFACIQKAKVSTCADMSEEFGRNVNFYNSNVWRTGERIYKKINCPLSEREEGGNRFWSVCCLGRDLKNGRFEFKIRPELQEAFDVTGVLEGIEVMEGKNISCIMANIAWNENDWKSPSDNKTNFRWTQVEGNIPNESWNFDFDNPRNTEKKIFGFIQFTHPPKNAEKDRFLIIFRSLNKIVGFYGNAEIKKEAVKKNEYEYSNIIGDKELVVLLDNKIDDSDNNFLFGKDRVGMIGFNYLNTNNAQTILDEAIKTNPNQIDTLEKIKEWLNQGDTQMTQENSLVKKYANLLKNTKNLILTGAPGTGKTYLAKTIAARLILDREINNFDKDLSEEEKKQFESQTGFVQFHPSYDYTDFVEGLRPTDKDGNGNVGFERRDGVFKKFCAKALKNFVDSRKSVEEVVKETILDKQFDDFINRFDDKNLSSDGDRTFSCKIYEDESGKYFACKYWSSDREYKITKDDILSKLEQNKPMGTFEKILYKEFNKFCNNQKNIEVNEEITEKISLKNFVFIIDEINRGEVAKIFGELFYCVDPGYRGKEGKINTQYQNLIKENNIFYSGFFIPENVYIIGTMNDIDRSVESMDFAFRRRFSWIEVKASDTVDMLDPKYDDNGELIAGLEKNLAEKAKLRMENLNAAIWDEKENKGIEGLNEAYHIGASYFLKLNNYDGDFDKLWEYHIKGILQEYLRGSGNEAKIAELKAAYDREEENNGK